MRSWSGRSLPQCCARPALPAAPPLHHANWRCIAWHSKRQQGVGFRVYGGGQGGNQAELENKQSEEVCHVYSGNDEQPAPKERQTMLQPIHQQI